LKINKLFTKDNIYILIGFIILLLFIFIALLVPLLSLPSPIESSRDVFLTPSKSHLLGTNDMGQDIFSRLLYGLRSSIFTSLSVGIIATFISVFLGTVSALIGGIVDRFILRFCDVLLAIPEFVICMLIASYIRPNIITLIFVISLLNWQGPLKVIRSQVVLCKEELYIYSARTLGASKRYILIKHIIPEISPLIVLTFIKNVRTAVFMEASLSYLGLVDANTVSWGRIMSNAMQFIYLDVWKWWLLPVGFLLSIFLLSLTYVGYYMENKQQKVSSL
jgi:peptide/nickel transport system permease protein